MILKCKIAVNKIDKKRLFHGAKCIYLETTLLENRDGVDQYGNHGMIVQDVTREEREAGIKGPILGNFKIVGKQPAQQQSSPANSIVNPDIEPESDEIPF